MLPLPTIGDCHRVGAVCDVKQFLIHHIGPSNALYGEAKVLKVLSHSFDSVGHQFGGGSLLFTELVEWGPPRSRVGDRVKDFFSGRFVGHSGSLAQTRASLEALIRFIEARERQDSQHEG